MSCEKRDQRQGPKKIEMNEIGIQTLLNFENIEDIVWLYFETWFFSIINNSSLIIGKLIVKRDR